MADPWSGGGSSALTREAPEAAVAFDDLVAMRPADVGEGLMADPAVTAFAGQFGVDVSVIDDEMRAAFTAATGPALFSVAQVVYVADVAARLRAALDALFGSSAWPVPVVTVADDSWSLVDGFMKAVARLRALDATTTELVRLRGARQHECRVCKSRRSVAALDEGADEALFAAVDDHAGSDLPGPAKAALALTDAMIWTPTAIPAAVVAAVRRHLTPAEAVEVALDVVRNAANKIAVSLAADAAEVTDGVQLFVTDPDGNLTVV